MHLKNLSLQHFRNHLDTRLDFSSNTNIFFGYNGHGKTNIIEAIAYLCLTKSFYANTDSLALNFGSDLFEIEGTFVTKGYQTINVRIAYSETQKSKAYLINRHRIEPLSSVIGKFPVVICSPEHTLITTGGPSERRKFVDFVISQSNDIYLQNLIEYRKVLKHRNKLLLDAKILRNDVKSLLIPWNEQLIELGSHIMYTRKNFTSAFVNFIDSAYQNIINKEEKPFVEYLPALISKDTPNNEKNIRDALDTEIKDKIDEEIKVGTSLVGPQRDEFKLNLNELELRKYASQGQHKSFLVALKIGEYFYLKERCNETPILLLDDIFSELDERRSGNLLNFVNKISQTFITLTNPNMFMGKETVVNDAKTFYIENGKEIKTG